jgi:hypothetical protein
MVAFFDIFLPFDLPDSFYTEIAILQQFYPKRKGTSADVPFSIVKPSPLSTWRDCHYRADASAGPARHALYRVYLVLAVTWRDCHYRADARASPARYAFHRVYFINHFCYSF